MSTSRSRKGKGSVRSSRSRRTEYDYDYDSELSLSDRTGRTGRTSRTKSLLFSDNESMSSHHYEDESTLAFLGSVIRYHARKVHSVLVQPCVDTSGALAEEAGETLAEDVTVITDMFSQGKNSSVKRTSSRRGSKERISNEEDEGPFGCFPCSAHKEEQQLEVVPPNIVKVRKRRSKSRSRKSSRSRSRRRRSSSVRRVKVIPESRSMRSNRSGKSGKSAEHNDSKKALQQQIAQRQELVSRKHAANERGGNDRSARLKPNQRPPPPFDTIVVDEMNLEAKLSDLTGMFNLDKETNKSLPVRPVTPVPDTDSVTKKHQAKQQNKRFGFSSAKKRKDK